MSIVDDALTFQGILLRQAVGLHHGVQRVPAMLEVVDVHRVHVGVQ